MPRKKSAVQTVSTSCGHLNDENLRYHRCTVSQAQLASSTAPRIPSSNPGVLKRFDGPSSSITASSPKAKGKRKLKEVPSVGDDVATEKPKPKRSRKAKDPDAPVPEKRGAMFKRKCPQNIMERYDRVLSQRFFSIDRRREGEELKEEFSVLGSTGNVYVVTIGKRPSCTCPDAMKGNHCKHILFVFTKVLQVPQSSHVWYQKALLTSELEEVFCNAPPAPTVMANARIREAYDRATGKVASSTGDAGQNRRMPGPEDSCPICYESMDDGRKSSLTWCQTCGNALHKECFQQWAKKKSTAVDCVYCRAPWISPGSKTMESGNTDEGYINLAHVVGMSPERDNSTYYRGPRRGQRFYGY